MLILFYYFHYYFIIFLRRPILDLKLSLMKILIDSGSTHNFINNKVVGQLYLFTYPTPEFQVMIANGKNIDCSGKCHNIKLTMGEYLLKSPMIATQMGGAYVVLGVQWL